MDRFNYRLLTSTLAIAMALAGGSAYAAGKTPDSAPSTATFDGKSYVSVFVGSALATELTGQYETSTVTDPVAGGGTIGVAVGTHFTPNVRGEVELSYSSHAAPGGRSIKYNTGDTGHTTIDGNVDTLYLLGNIWYDFDLGGPVTPYIGVGIGAAELLPNLNQEHDPRMYQTPSWGVAGQLGAGLKFSLADDLSIDIGYRAKTIFNASLIGTPGDGYQPWTITGEHSVDQTVQVGVDVGF